MNKRELPYTPNGLLASFNRSRNFRARFGTKIDEIKPAIDHASKLIFEGRYNFGDLKKAHVNGKVFYKVTSSVDDLVLMHCFNNLRRSLNINYPNRHIITKQLSILLKEDTPFQFIKLDVKNFYESIPVKKVLSIIDAQQNVSPVTKVILHRLIDKTNLKTCKNLPRGLGLSSVLAEIFMKSFDDAVRENHSFYYYARYVDDIICFSSALDNSPLSFLKNLLGEHELRSNEDKQNIVIRDCDNRPRCKRVCSCEVVYHRIEYLGYSYEFINRPNPKKENYSLQIDIADSKVKRHKTRLVSSICDFHRTGDFYLLRDRIRFLTANYWIRSQVERSNLRSGFYFNYPLLNENSKALRSLDDFLKTKLHSKSGPARTRLAGSISPHQSHVLEKYSFTRAYTNRITYWFTEIRLSEIRNCWKYE